MLDSLSRQTKVFWLENLVGRGRVENRLGVNTGLGRVSMQLVRHGSFRVYLVRESAEA